MADSTYEEHAELGDPNGNRSPRLVRRSKHYEDLVLKQLRKTSRQFCLETAYACDRHNVNYRCAVEVTHRHIGQDEYGQISNTKSASHLSEKTRVSIRDAQSITAVGAAPDCKAAAIPVQRTRHSLGQELACNTASPLHSESHVPLMTSALRCDRPSLLEDRPCQMRTAQLGSPAAVSGHTNVAHCALDHQCPSECGTTMSNSDGLKCDAFTYSTTSHGRGAPQPGGFAREGSCGNDAAVSVQASQETLDEKNSPASLMNGENINITEDASSYKQKHINDKCTSVIVQRELHITEVLRHRSFLDDQQKKSEISGSDYHSSDEELTLECESPKCNEDGSDSGTGIEVYRPDNPCVLRKKIDDLEGQIQDLQEANVATYAEVLRLQQENDVLRQQNDGSRAQLSSSGRSYGSERHERGSSRGTSRSRSSSKASVSSSSSSKPSDMLGSRCSTLQSSKEALCEGQERLQKNENAAMEQREEYLGSMRMPSVADGHAPKCTHAYRNRGEAELASTTSAAPRTPPYSLRPTRLKFDDDEDDDICRSQMTSSPVGYTVSSTFSHELDVTKLWISSSDATIGSGISWSPATATRAVVPRTPADISLGDAVKYTQRDGRVGRGYAKHVGWCNERKRMCVAVTSNPPDWLQPLSSSPSARRETEEIVPFEKVLLIWKKGMVHD